MLLWELEFTRHWKWQQSYMAAKCIKIYKPDSEKKDWYKKHYQEYLKLAEAVNKLS